MKKNNFNFINKTSRPWGVFYVLHDEKKYKLKRIEVDPNQKLSYQYHFKRSETWTIVEGKGSVVINDKLIHVKAGDFIQIPQESKHRLINDSSNKLVLIEVQTGSYFGEDDIVRIEDDYNRV